MPQILRLAAFSTDPAGGNPAGVVLDAEALDDTAMQRIAADVDYAETAFITGRDAEGLTIRYFSPIAEVPFCGHATVATAVALVTAGVTAPGELTFRTPVGPVVIRTAQERDDVTASFTSVEPYVEHLPADVLAALLGELGIGADDLDPRMPPALAFAGNRHPVIALADRDLFDSFTFDPARVRALMDAQDWRGTVTVLHAPDASDIEARNLFPVGRITEDPATGSAAASVGAYLRALPSLGAEGRLTLPASVTIRQGAHVGRPGRLEVAIPAAGGITVTGRAVEIT